ncbi:MAG: zinc metallopeptidase [Thiohalobacterales bacterium]|nr:zinc metallopeptidase [Thiohalobacterales bacterium]
MNPVIILVPAAVLIIGPRLWVNHVLRQYNSKEEDFPGTARELAREVLDENGLPDVRVESTDIGDHYDPEARVVRIARDKIDRKTLTAVTTAAHEVSHALQHASGYAPFYWRRKLVKVAQVAGEAGMVLLLAAPVAALISRQPLPPRIIGSTALAMLGTGMVSQLSALPTELNASFGRALPILADGYVDEERLADAKRILMACSLTYIASSMVAVLHVWPWLGRPALSGSTVLPLAAAVQATASRTGMAGTSVRRVHTARHRRAGLAARLLRACGKPVIREWVRLSRSL